MADSHERVEADEQTAVSILIVTHNRRDEVLVAIESALAQDWQSLEVLVFDDVSSDGSPDAIEKEFPEVRLWRSGSKKSANVLRNQGFREAKGDIVISIDDDSYFTDRSTVSLVVSQFHSRPGLAVLGLPYIEPFNTSAHATSVLSAGEPIASYTGCAVALRTKVVLGVGGYRDWWGYYREESDLAIRIHSLGYELEQGSTPILVHTKSPKRDVRIQDRYAIRNQIYFLWMNLPIEHALFRSIAYFFGMLSYRFHVTDIPKRLRAYTEGFLTLPRHISERRSVSRACYRRFRSLPSHGKTHWSCSSVPGPCGVDKK